jgi:hypothetical protein
MPVLAAFLHMLREMQPPICIVENVAAFPAGIFDAFVGDLYEAVVFPECSPECAGFGLLRRARLYIALVHKGKARVVHDMLDLFHKVVLHNRVSGAFLPSHALVADASEVTADLWHKMWARGLRPFVGCSHWDALTRREQQSALGYVGLYRERFGQDPHCDRDLVVFLGDNSWNRQIWSATTRQVPTFRTNSGLYWHVPSGTWLLARERFAIMGFPVYPFMARAMNAECLQIDPSVLAGAVGNSMHLGVVYTVLLCVLASTERR